MAFVPSGGEFRVNTQTSGDQLAPAITALPDGGFLAVWDDASGTLGDADGRGIKAQRYDAFANPVGGEFLVNTQTAGDQLGARVTSLRDGRFVVTWTDASGASDGSASSVQAQIFSASGVKVGTEFVVNSTTSSAQTAGDIAALSNGGFVVTWNDNGTAKAQAYNAGGSRVGGEITVDPTIGTGNAPRVTDLEEGRFVVTWSDDNGTTGDDSDDRVRAKIYDATGAQVGTEIAVSAGAGQDPDIATSFFRGFIVTWVDPTSTSSDIKAKQFLSDGSGLGSELPVNTTTTGSQKGPTIVAASGARFVIAWTDFSAGVADPDIRAQVFDVSADPVGTEFMVNTQASLVQDAPALAGMNGDGFAVVWADQSGTLGDSSGYGIKAQLYQDDATGVNEPPVNNGPGTLTATHAAMHIDVSFTDDAVRPVNTSLPSYPGVHTLTLTAAHGTLTGTKGKIFSDTITIEGDGTRTLKFTGNPEALNGGIGIAYQADVTFFGPDTLTVTINDGGETGTGGPKSDTDSFTINVGPMFTGTSGDDSFVASQGLYQGFFGSAGNDTWTSQFSLSDSLVHYLSSRFIVEHVPTLSTSLPVDIETFVFADGTVHVDDGSPLVDDLFYYSRSRDVWSAKIDAEQHFNTSGRHEGRDPNAFFSTSFYLWTNPDVAAAGVNPLAHFDTSGWREGRLPSVAFDPAQYLSAYPDVAAANVDPLAHFLQFGMDEGRVAFALTRPVAVGAFDYRYYLATYRDVAAAGIDPLVHFQQFGWQEGRNPNALFDTQGYLATYTDVAAAGVNPLDHYGNFGWREGRDPSASFDTTAYLAAYADVAAAGVNPLAHYLQFGFTEGRATFADGTWG